jgi:P27 family predicted phage terminase small subunit
MRGRKSKPTQLKVLQGNPGKRPLNSDEPAFPALQSDCPEHLVKASAKEWDRMKGLFASHNVFTEADRSALTAYCTVWGRWLEADGNVRKSGMLVKSPSGYAIQNPWLSIANKAFDQMTKLMTEFGMTPSSRSCVKTIQTKTLSGVKRLLG